MPMQDDGQADARLLIESVTDYALLMLSADGLVTTWNPGAQNLKGYTEAEIIGQPYARFFCPEDARAGRPQSLLDRAAREGKVEDEGWRMRKDGSRFWALAVISAVRSDSGELLGYAKVTRDLTERVLREQAQAEHLRGLQAMDRFKDEFLALISHELRTPLNFIMGFASYMEDAPDLPAHHRSYTGKILEGAERMLHIVNDLLDVAAIQAGKLHLEPEPMAVAPLVDAVLSSLAPLADRKSIQMTTGVDPALRPTFDPDRITQVLTNLVGNAIKFTPIGGVIDVTSNLVDGHIRLEVRDSGIGIAPEHLAAVFERFEQVDMSQTRSTGGTGLGLAITRALVEAHGGTIGVESTYGSGSCFWFTLPDT